MEAIILKSRYVKKRKKRNNELKLKKKNILLLVTIFALIICIIIFFNKITQRISKLENRIKHEVLNKDLIEKSIKEQNDFCNNQKANINKQYESKIVLAEVDYNNKTYNTFVYKFSDIISNSIKASKGWEGKDTIKILNALNYYSNKKNIKKEDIYILDIGANIGWYSFYLGKYGYKIISFEPDIINYYILKKTYCINKDVNVILINRGLYTEEKKCDYYLQIGNEGNGLIFCDKNAAIQNILRYKGEVYLTKLSNFMPFLSDKNIAFVKIDVEGSEEKVIRGGIELITKYHVPFIFMEWAPNNLNMHKVDKKEFLLLFINNGYKFSSSNFLDQNYISIDDILKVGTDTLINLYITYTKILE